MITLRITNSMVPPLFTVKTNKNEYSIYKEILVHEHTQKKVYMKGQCVLMQTLKQKG